eukprot:TRINITY_DN33853_c0_g1_i1.p1 TRINITY_DN33853_c0_g1~~TRINITY_DN33853_c0_g1_i1.p1  ORF type:complete len:182 (+),score=17.48 TRINITY_DN33853_c0_g1_i1:28-546(+)
MADPLTTAILASGLDDNEQGRALAREYTAQQQARILTTAGAVRDALLRELSNAPQQVGVAHYSGALLYNSWLARHGLPEPWEQYTLYGTSIWSTYRGVRIFQKEYFLSRFVKTNEEKYLTFARATLAEAEIARHSARTFQKMRGIGYIALAPMAWLAFRTAWRSLSQKKVKP